MPEQLGTVTATLRDWEDGTDLVLSTRVPAPVQRAWQTITDPAGSDQWFAPWQPAAGAGCDDREAGRAPSTIAFVFDEGTMEAQVLAAQPEHHVLLEITGLGRVGISLEPSQSSQTHLIVTHTFETPDAARAAVPEIGPVWHTHLSMLAALLGAPARPPSESELAAYYDQVAGGGDD